jgi:hypothetical protein
MPHEEIEKAVKILGDKEGTHTDGMGADNKNNIY